MKQIRELELTSKVARGNHISGDLLSFELDHVIQFFQESGQHHISLSGNFTALELCEIVDHMEKR